MAIYNVSIVIRCCNEEEHIGRLLSGILQQTVRNVEIIVVDSGSTDATLSIAERYPVKIIKIQPEEFSFGRALNIGCEAASGPFIVIASAHVYPVYKDWLAKLLAPFADQQVALVYGKQRGNEMTKYFEHQVFARWFPEKSNLNQEHPFCNNANSAIRKDLWEKIPYDEELTGIEDIDWAKRAMTQGCRIAYIADAEIIHVHNESPERIFNRYRREAIALKRIFPHEQFSLGDFFKMYTSNVISDGFHAWHDHAFLRSIYGILVFRLMQFLGTYRGFSQHSAVTSELKKTFYYPNGLKNSKKKSPDATSDRLINYSYKPL
ncbi:Glycosyl transferase family 2 [Syntrophus gentianae]|uniref:Glycosyl transferase family 2 n=1 Tax=Syntrophus gentianae TaxID=43775 RepID=A0A1H7X7W1_9BACT|nr:glycosyltransferase [Syntrophus gentianae]SEM29763.1 Glycosyl transferase family 2 [Syntrophus gentianae]